MKTRPANLTRWGFFTITLIMVMDLHEYTVFASSGFQLIFFLLVGGIFWFMPVALCSAEMTTVEGWEESGLFSWIENTLGLCFGFAALFFQWFQVTVGFIAMLYFVLSTLTSFFDLQWIDNNPLLQFIGIMVIFWTLTLSQFGGIKRTALIDRIGLIAGVIIPCSVLAGVFVSYVAGGNPMHIEISPQALIPDFSQPSTLVVFVAFILSYAGIEASASYVNELDNPKHKYPRVLFLVVIVAIVLNTVGGLSIAAVVPASELSFSGGMMQALQTLFEHVNSNLVWGAGIVALLIAGGVMGEISGWILGPIQGMHAAAQQGFLPKVFRRVNRANVPVPLLVAQGIIVTIWGAILTFGGGGNNLSFIAAISLTVVIYLMAYILLFVGYFVLILKKENLKRTYHVPGGIGGKCLVATCGLGISLFSLCISFVPPSTVESTQTGIYEIILVVGFVCVLALPFIIFAFRDKKTPRHKQGTKDSKNLTVQKENNDRLKSRRAQGPLDRHDKD